MSTRSSGERPWPSASTADDRVPGAWRSPRSLALVGLLTMIAGYCTTLYWVTTVVGGSLWLIGSIGIGLLAGVLLRTTAERTVASVAGAGVLLVAVGYYAVAAPAADLVLLARATIDGGAMVSGISIRHITAADAWITALVPIPIFLSTYLGLRRRYVAAALAGSWLVCFLALTGDATPLETLVGTIGIVAAVGFGELDRRGGSVDGANLLVVLLAIMAVVAVAVPMVPSGSASEIDPTDIDPDLSIDQSGPADPVPLDDQLLSGDTVTAGGPINLSSEVRFVVHSESRQRYRLDAFGSYDGERWYRSGENNPLIAAPPGPPGDGETVRQRFELRGPAVDVPSASYPVDVENLSDARLEVTTTGALTVDGRLPAGTNYTITSEVPDPNETTLQRAGTEYPAAIEQRYLQLPDGAVPERVANLTSQVTAEATTPYETARAVEGYLEDNKEYSQNVSAPSGTMVDGFLFEMDAGYCTYFASSMATMLRTQDVPARVAVGYNGGQWVGNDTWVVRGTDAHAWVEVYFPNDGWVEFDPTPSGPAQAARQSAVESARANGVETVDVPESAGDAVTFERPTEETAPNESDGTDGTDESTGQTNDTGDDSSGSTAYSGLPYNPGNVSVSSVEYVQPDVPTETDTNDTGSNASTAIDARTGRRLLDGLDATVLALVLAAGVVAGGHRAGVSHRLRRVGGVVWQRRRDPETDVRRAIDRLDAWLEYRHGPRRAGETRREYRRRLPDDIDPAVEHAYELHERASYGGAVDREVADDLVATVDGIVRQSVPGLRRLD